MLKNKAQQGRWPKQYLSWSQFDLFNKSPKEYALRYIYGDNPTNPAMELGKAVATMLEHDIEQEDVALEHVRIFLPSYPHKEYEVRASISSVPLLGKLDGWNEKLLHIGEYKTGRSWTQQRADQTKQLTFYALLIHLALKIPVERIGMTLHWLPTEWNNGNPVITGEIVNFHTRRSTADVLVLGAEIISTWRKIGEFCAKEYQSIGL